ncbi:MAG: NAD(+)/NADH kinase [Chitinophagaceae bacterium]|nr:NAD(+)/NADH kinase [Chitinophagaceae bacterium]
MNIEYAIIVRNKTRLELLIERFNTKAQAKFYIERMGGDFGDYEKEHEKFYTSIAIVQQHLSKVVKHKIIDRSFLPSFIFNEKQVVVTIGQDGLVANTAKYVNGIPIVAINPDHERYDGVLLPFQPDNFIPAVESVIQDKYNAKETFLAEAKLNDGQRLLAFNDLFIGASTHISARYKITYNNKSEEHSSSGIIVSTKAGSTGWLSSIVNMTYGMHRFIEQMTEKKKKVAIKDDQLVFAVREPFASKKTQTGIQAGILTDMNKLTIESFMPNYGVIFSDGVESDFLRFNSGSIVTINTAKEKARLVINN